VERVTCRKKKEKMTTDLSSDTKSKCATKDDDAELVAAEDRQQDVKSEEEVILINR